MSSSEFLFESFDFKITFEVLSFHIQKLGLECVQFLFKNNLTSSLGKCPWIWILLRSSRAGPWSTFWNLLFFLTLAFVARSRLIALIRFHQMGTLELATWSDVFIPQLNQIVFILSIPIFLNVLLPKYVVQMMLLNIIITIIFFDRDVVAFTTLVSMLLFPLYLLI